MLNPPQFVKEILENWRYLALFLFLTCCALAFPGLVIFLALQYDDAYMSGDLFKMTVLLRLAFLLGITLVIYFLAGRTPFRRFPALLVGVLLLFQGCTSASRRHLGTSKGELLFAGIILVGVGLHQKQSNTEK